MAGMGETFVISDTHFGHAGILTFRDGNGKPVRPFDSVDEMDELMVDNWNRIVRPSDKVYHLGDVSMRKDRLPIVERLNGKKSLIMGNHDIFMAKEYLRYFSNVRGVKVIDNHILTHLPVVRSGRFVANVHGHMHANVLPDMWYFNVCVEVRDYTPMPWGMVKELIDDANERKGIE